MTAGFAPIGDAAASVARGEHDEAFPLDVFQTGSGTSSNMNANEVIATLASRGLGRAVHPNDHVDASQSSNDVFPTAIGLAGRVLAGHRDRAELLHRLRGGRADRPPGAGDRPAQIRSIVISRGYLDRGQITEAQTGRGPRRARDDPERASGKESHLIDA